MADYWISQPRKFCEFCKCWTADNKASRDFHEKGKKHQQNVKDKISQVMKKGVTDSKKESEMNNMLKQMEQKAMNALKKDIQNNPSMAAQYGVKLKSEDPEPSPLPIPEINDSSSGDDSDAEVEKVTEDEPNELWKEEWTPEGHVYYWHTITGESSWVAPEGYTPTWERAGKSEEKGDKVTEQPATDNTREKLPNVEETAVGEEAADRTASEINTAAASPPQPEPLPDLTDTFPGDVLLPADIPLPPELPSTKDTPEPCSASDTPEPPTTSDTTDSNQSSDTTEATSSSNHANANDLPAPVRKPDKRYGAWETIPEPVEQRPVDLQLPDKHSAAVEVRSIPLNEPKLKFRQKKVDTLGAEFVAFKKRKMNSANKERSLRTTDTERD